VNHDASIDEAFDVITGTGPSGPTLKVIGEIDVATSPALRRALHELVDQGAAEVVVDLSQTTFIDSSGLGVLVGALRRLREADGPETIVLQGLQDPVRKVFEITGLTTVFTIRD
jgi:anti-sigma B factor antagonist